MNYINELVSRYRGKGLLIDTNLLLLYFVGMYDQDRITKFKRTRSFSTEDFQLLAGFIGNFKRLITTPNILTEVSNLSGQLSEVLRSGFYKDFATRIGSFDEDYLTSVGIASFAHFDKFGLTDSGIVELVKNKYLVLTDDLTLFAYLQNQPIDAINFNHIRPLTWN